MDITFRKATVEDAESISSMVLELTNEIGERTNVQHFDINPKETIERCQQLMSDGHYTAILGFSDTTPIAVATFTETYALYCGGKIGLIQEFYVSPTQRSLGVGEMLLNQVKEHGVQHSWSCIELCTPPLPEFAKTLSFYQLNGLKPVGGRKMRVSL
ncbi:GNAT family N-acetyltransferase [Marinomonas balearica]|uniref:Acetyltransferase (GNAT) family protein n=1 Tax=Marinomonas balearica TaxID=491947 RepID=A0A4R6MBH3_9GAMM|nr:GNAT family N-acetyltransferase [Marinomonas balearica]TDO98957.1 acetyltransferase (GNAT) family protein [Marinomonas balearica]